MQFIQLPDFGADFSQEGKIAKRVNGKASASAKPNIPTAGPMILPDVPISTSRKPIIGPVQEKLTKANVNAIRNMLSKPDVEEAFLSTMIILSSSSAIYALRLSNNKRIKDSSQFNENGLGVFRNTFFEILPVISFVSR